MMGFTFRKRTSNGEIRRPGLLASVRTVGRSCKITPASSVNNENKKLKRQPTTTTTTTTESTPKATSSILSSVRSNTSKIVKNVQIFPMVNVQEFQPYSEKDKKRIFMSQEELHEIRERHRSCVQCMAYPLLAKLFVSENDNLECTRGLETNDDIRKRLNVREKTLRFVLSEQARQKRLGHTINEHYIAAKSKFISDEYQLRALEVGLLDQKEAFEIYYEGQ